MLYTERMVLRADVPNRKDYPKTDTGVVLSPIYYIGFKCIKCGGKTRHNRYLCDKHTDYSYERIGV